MRARLELGSWAEAEAFLKGRASRKVANNTYLERITSTGAVTADGDYGIAVRLHRTRVVTYRPNGDVELDTGGWFTVTTKDRLNRYLPGDWRVGSDRGEWRLYRNGEPMYVYADGCTLHPDGTASDAEPYRKGQRRTRHARRGPGARRGYYSRDYFGIAAAVMNRGEEVEERGERLPEPETLAIDDSGADDARVAALFADAGVEDAESRWAEMNRKFNALLCKRAEA